MKFAIVVCAALLASGCFKDPEYVARSSNANFSVGLDAFVNMVCEQYQRENPTMVMWPAGYGSKITSMGIAAGDEHIDFDDSVYAIEVSAREDYYGENPHNPERDKLKHRAHIERAVRKGKPVETLVNGVWIDAEVKPLPFDFQWDQYDYRLPVAALA